MRVLAPSPQSEAARWRTADVEPANHNYDSNDFFEALASGNMPAVVFLKAPAYQDAHPGYSDPIDEQAFVISVINAIQDTKFWATTAVIIAYDDSDGWYDHQAPPIVNPSSLAAIGNPTGAVDTTDQLNGAGLCTGTQVQQGHITPTTALLGTDGGTRSWAVAATAAGCRSWSSRRTRRRTSSTTP